MPCSLSTWVVPCCLHGWHQGLLLYVASWSFWSVGFQQQESLQSSYVPWLCIHGTSRKLFALHSVYLHSMFALRLPSAMLLLALCFISGMLLFFENCVSTAGYQFLSFYPSYIMCCICAHTKVFFFFKVGLDYCAPLLRPVLLLLIDCVWDWCYCDASRLILSSVCSVFWISLPHASQFMRQEPVVWWKLSDRFFIVSRFSVLF